MGKTPVSTHISRNTQLNLFGNGEDRWVADIPHCHVLFLWGISHPKYRFGVYRPLKKGHIHRCVCNIHISCIWNSTADSVFLVEKHGKTICFELPYSKIKWIWKLFPASNTPWPYWGWLDWRFIRTASELRIFGAVGFSWVFHMFFPGFPWIFLGFPYVGVSSSSPGEASRDCCGQGVRNGGYPTIGWLRGCSWGYYMVIVIVVIKGWLYHVKPLLVIGLIVGSYRFPGVIACHIALQVPREPPWL
jgi:hypothetical protein